MQPENTKAPGGNRELSQNQNLFLTATNYSSSSRWHNRVRVFPPQDEASARTLYEAVCRPLILRSLARSVPVVHEFKNASSATILRGITVPELRLLAVLNFRGPGWHELSERVLLAATELARSCLYEARRALKERGMLEIESRQSACAYQLTPAFRRAFPAMSSAEGWGLSGQLVRRLSLTRLRLLVELGLRGEGWHEVGETELLKVTDLARSTFYRAKRELIEGGLLEVRNQKLICSYRLTAACYEESPLIPLPCNPRRRAAMAARRGQ